MILIADSGSSKCDWALFNSNTQNIKYFTTSGINPFLFSEEDILYIFKKELIKEVKTNAIKKIFFYAAGASNSKVSKKMLNIFKIFFTISDIYIYHDLLAAARSLCFNKPGLVAILGTGSNSCLYNGKNIEKNIPSLGYLLGDEGSAVYIGKLFLKNLLRNNLPRKLEQKIYNDFSTDKYEIMNKVYSAKYTNNYLSSFSIYISKNIKVKEFQDIIFNAFDDFMINCITKYPEFNKYKLNALGSVAFHFKDILDKVCKKYNLKLGKIIKSPIKNLVKFHLNYYHNDEKTNL